MADYTPGNRGQGNKKDAKKTSRILDIVSMEQCVNPATGEFRVLQKESISGGTGLLAEAARELIAPVFWITVGG